MFGNFLRKYIIFQKKIQKNIENLEKECKNYSNDSRTVTFCDFLSNFRKNTPQNTTKP